MEAPSAHPEAAHARVTHPAVMFFVFLIGTASVGATS
jgi:hypothetical protein